MMAVLGLNVAEMVRCCMDLAAILRVAVWMTDAIVQKSFPDFIGGIRN